MALRYKTSSNPSTWPLSAWMAVNLQTAIAESARAISLDAIATAAVGRQIGRPVTIIA